MDTTTMRTPSPASISSRKAVRPKRSEAPFTAYQLLTDQRLELPTGSVWGRIGEWVVCKGGIVVDLLPDKFFREQYEDVGEGGLLVTGPARADLERVLGFGSTQTPEHLVTAVKRMAGLKIGGIEVDFSPGQWDDLAHRAQKRGMSVAALLKQVIDRITSEIWSVAAGA